MKQPAVVRVPEQPEQQASTRAASAGRRGTAWLLSTTGIALRRHGATARSAALTQRPNLAPGKRHAGILLSSTSAHERRPTFARHVADSRATENAARPMRQPRVPPRRPCVHPRASQMAQAALFSARRDIERQVKNGHHHAGHKAPYCIYMEVLSPRSTAPGPFRLRRRPAQAGCLIRRSAPPPQLPFPGPRRFADRAACSPLRPSADTGWI